MSLADLREIHLVLSADHWEVSLVSSDEARDRPPEPSDVTCACMPVASNGSCECSLLGTSGGVSEGSVESSSDG